MKKNDVLAALYTMGIIGVFGLVCWMIRDFPNLTWWITTGLVSLLVFMVVIYPLWDTIKWELNERDKRKKCEIDLDLDENDKAQIG
jgi:hypothetical protein